MGQRAQLRAIEKARLRAVQRARTMQRLSAWKSTPTKRGAITILVLCGVLGAACGAALEHYGPRARAFMVQR